MFTSFVIENFRGFHDLSLQSLKRINLFAGMNNVGKTALLEAIFLHLGPSNPDLALRVNAFRGMEQFSFDAEQAWGWLFYGKDLNSTIALTSRDDSNIERQLKISVHQEFGVFPIIKEAREADIIKLPLPASTRPSYPTLVLEYKDSSEIQSKSKGIMTPNGLSFEISNSGIPMIPGVFLSTRFWSTREDAERFSKLAELGLETEILPTLRLLEPRLRRLALLVAGGMSIIHGDVGIGRLIPINMMGEGLSRLLSLLLTVFTTKSGCVLIDEIENGLHYSIMQNIWKALQDAAKQSDTQIFATTHSRECILAAHKGIEETGDYNFSLYRLERLNENIVAVAYDREMLATAEEFSMEVR